MAGPVISLPNKNPPTSPTMYKFKFEAVTKMKQWERKRNKNVDSPKKPAKASMATRPCFNSASLYLINSLSVSGQRARGSKNPKGAVIPASPLGSKTI